MSPISITDSHCSKRTTWDIDQGEIRRPRKEGMQQAIVHPSCLVPQVVDDSGCFMESLNTIGSVPTYTVPSNEHATRDM